jgi:hypothetical protein
LVAKGSDHSRRLDTTRVACNSSNAFRAGLLQCQCPDPRFGPSGFGPRTDGSLGVGNGLRRNCVRFGPVRLPILPPSVTPAPQLRVIAPIAPSASALHLPGQPQNAEGTRLDTRAAATLTGTGNMFNLWLSPRRECRRLV